MPNSDIAISGTYYMIALYTMTPMIQLINERYKEDINVGDVFVTNCPFTASVHQNDVQFVAPFFEDGKIVAWTGCMAHVLDLGGKYPGSWVPDAVSCFEEGLRVPLTRIVDGGRLNQALWDTIMHTSRLPAMVANDFSAFLSSHRVTHERLRELCDRYGADLVHDTMAQAIEETERDMREIIRSLPDAETSSNGYYDHNGFQNNVYSVPVKLIKSHDELIFDFTGADPQLIGMGNATKWGTLGAIATALLGSVGQKLSWNAGILGPIHMLLGPKTILSAELPAPVSAGSTSANWLAATGAATCISKLLVFNEKYSDLICAPPDGSWLLAQFGGMTREGEPFAIMYMDSLCWGGPAFGHRDGVDSGGSLVAASGGCNDVELHEKTTPLHYLWRPEVPNSGGAGRYPRGKRNRIRIGR
jgi:N-methylhydantoinase B